MTQETALSDGKDELQWRCASRCVSGPLAPTTSKAGAVSWVRLTLAGIALGLALFVIGAAQPPPLPSCPGCAVVTQDWPGCNGEAVVGGWVCQ